MEVGVILGIFEFAGMMSSLILGNYLIKIGSRFMFIAGTFVLGVSSSLFGWLIHAKDGFTFVGLCAIVRVFQGVSSSAISTASFVVLAHIFSGSMSSVMGGLETCCGLGFIAGPPIGGLLYSLGGFQFPFFLVGGITMLMCILSFFLMPSIKDRCDGKPHSYFPLIKECGLLIPLLATILATSSMSFVDLSLSHYLETFKLSLKIIDLMFLANSASYAITAPLWGILVDKKQCAKLVMMMGGFIGATAFVLLGPIRFIDETFGSLNIAWIAMVILGSGISALIIPPFIDALNLATHCGYQKSLGTFGLISGLTNTCYSLGSFIGPLVGGVVVEKFGFIWSITVLAILHSCLGLFIGIYMAAKAWKGRRCAIENIS